MQEVGQETKDVYICHLPLLPELIQKKVEMKPERRQAPETSEAAHRLFAGFTLCCLETEDQRKAQDGHELAKVNTWWGLNSESLAAGTEALCSCPPSLLFL